MGNGDDDRKHTHESRDDKMNDHLDISVKISTQIGELNGFIKSALDKLADHEKRIGDLEKTKGSTLKDTALQWLLKGLIASIFIIGSLTGAGGLLKGLFGL